MSTAGSGPDRGAVSASKEPAPAYTPDAAATPTLPRPPRTRIVRWQGVIPLVLVVVLLVIGWILFADPIARSTFQQAASEALGTEVDLDGLHIDATHTSVALRGLQIADPFDPKRNLLDIASVNVVIE